MIRSGMEALIEQERESKPRNLDREAKVWTKKLAEHTRLRSAYQDQQAAGLMTLQELGAKLAELEQGREEAERELLALRSHQQRVEELEKERYALLQSMAEAVPAALEDLEGEEKNRLYQMLRLEVVPSEEGYEVSGAFCTSGLISPLVRRKGSWCSRATVIIGEKRPRPPELVLRSGEPAGRDRATEGTALV
jgi:hypothetical protein